MRARKRQKARRDRKLERGGVGQATPRECATNTLLNLINNAISTSSRFQDSTMSRYALSTSNLGKYT